MSLVFTHKCIAYLHINHSPRTPVCQIISIAFLPVFVYSSWHTIISKLWNKVMAPEPNKKGLVAVGAYLRRLRTHWQMTPTVTAASVGTDPSMLNRIEKGNIDTRGSLLLALTQAVGGNVSDVQRLMHDQYATAMTGEQRANAWLALLETPPTPDEVQQLSQAVTTLAQPATTPTLSDEEQRQRLALLRATLRELTPRSDDPPVHS
jgi:hypothetical protein